MSSTRGRIRLVATIAAAWALTSGCALRQARAQDDFGIPVCPAAAKNDLLSPDALQCWFTASHGHWRTLSHQSHLEALVVEVEARDLRDAVEIARRVTEDPKARAFSEILVYVARQHGRESRIRRVRWTQSTGFETLDFASPSGDTPLTIRSRPSLERASGRDLRAFFDRWVYY
jgi:hypothetical protein